MILYSSGSNTSATIRSIYFCKKCHKQWRSMDTYGFLSCPLCLSFDTISTVMDNNVSHDSLPGFNGLDHSTVPKDSNGNKYNSRKDILG